MILQTPTFDGFDGRKPGPRTRIIDDDERNYKVIVTVF